MTNNAQTKIAIGVAIAAGTVGAASIAYWYKKKFETPPATWKHVGEVVDLNCFPIKSCAPIKQDSFECNILGLEINENVHDRVFMIVTPDNQFVTARAYPKFLLIRPEIDGNLLKLSAPGKPQIIVNIVELQNEESRKAVVWSQEINAVDAGDNVAQWISSFVLGTDDGFRLVYYVPKVPTRDVRGKNRPFKNIKNIDAGALHDATGYMLINQASIDDLNGRIDHIVKPLQFRPNIVIKGPDAWEEDHWKWIRVGDVVFRNIKPCTRCIFTNINPDNAERDPKQQVLKTLKEYRSIVPNDSPVMGIHIGLRGEGTLSIGDQVFIGVDE